MARQIKPSGRQRGSAQIEFILTFFTIMFVLFGVIEIAMAVYAMNVLGDAAREGVRYGIVHGEGNTNSVAVRFAIPVEITSKPWFAITQDFVSTIRVA